MPVLKVEIRAEVDGRELRGFPKVFRREVPELQPFVYEQADHGDAVTFTALPADQIASIQALILSPDNTITLRLDGQSDAGIVINPDGLVCLIDVTIDAGAGASNAQINNNNTPAATVTLDGIAGGT